MTKDFTGQTYNYLTFIKPSNKKYKGSILWEMQCKCGTICYKKACNVQSGHTKSCGCKHRECYPRKYTPLIRTARSVWGWQYKDGCDFETFYKLSQERCYYCNRLPYRSYNIANQYNKRWSQQRVDDGNFIYN